MIQCVSLYTNWRELNQSINNNALISAEKKAEYAPTLLWHSVK